MPNMEEKRDAWKDREDSEEIVEWRTASNGLLVCIQSAYDLPVIQWNQRFIELKAKPMPEYYWQ